MSEMLAIEWSGQEIRVALATGHGHRVVIEHAFSAPWNGADGRRIAEELDRRGIGRPPALVAVDRSRIELRQLQLPPAPDEDLPDMVRFQAAREFNELNEEWLLDFVPIDEAADGPRTVLAMAIAPAVIRQIEEVCEAAGLKMQRLLLRPCATASLLPPQGPETQAQVAAAGRVVGRRGRSDGRAGRQRGLSADDAAGGGHAVAAGIEAEIRLTVAAAHNQFSGRKVRSIVICGQDAGHAELARNVQTNAGIPAELFDPFAGLELGPTLRGKLPEHPGRFAPLLGMLVTELKNAGQTIDFLHPRRRAPPPASGRKWSPPPPPPRCCCWRGWPTGG